MTPTPRTDAIASKGGLGPEYAGIRAHIESTVPADFARDLERERNAWKDIAGKLARALDGCRKRYVLTLGEITGDPEPSFDPPAPSQLDNLHAVTLALAEYDILSNTSVSGPHPADDSTSTKSVHG